MELELVVIEVRQVTLQLFQLYHQLVVAVAQQRVVVMDYLVVQVEEVLIAVAEALETHHLLVHLKEIMEEIVEVVLQALEVLEVEVLELLVVVVHQLLVALVENHNRSSSRKVAITGGILDMAHLVPELIKHGRPDVAFDVLAADGPGTYYNMARCERCYPFCLSRACMRLSLRASDVPALVAVVQMA